MSVTLKSRLPNLAKAIQQEASRIVRRTALNIEAEAKQLAPVDTGTLRASITTYVDDPLHAVVATNADYAVYQEFGTRHQSGQPFMTPAADSERQNFIDAMRKLEQGLK